MKKLLQTFAFLGVLFTLTSAMCETEDPEPVLLDFNCKCTYVPSDPTLANKEEITPLKAESNTKASYDCSVLSGKYISQFYHGTCVLQ